MPMSFTLIFSPAVSFTGGAGLVVYMASELMGMLMKRGCHPSIAPITPLPIGKAVVHDLLGVSKKRGSV